MSRGGKKTKHDLLARVPLEFLEDAEGAKDRKWFEAFRWKTVAPKTRRQYRQRHKYVVDKYGGHTFAHLVRYLRVDKKHVVATKRGTVSAVNHVRFCMWDKVPREHVEALTYALDAMEVEEAEREERASLSVEMYEQLIHELYRSGTVPPDTCAGAEVMYGLACRTFNIRDMTVDRVNLQLNTVQCERKATELNKRRGGRYDVKAIGTNRARDILQKRMIEAKQKGLARNVALFQDWQPDLVGKTMRECARKYRWPAGVKYCCYCLRHTAATVEYEKAHEAAKTAVRERLAHRSTGNEMRYGASTAVKKERRGHHA
jgi:integrase